MKQMTVTTGTEWRRTKEEGVLVPLPSGKVAALRDISLQSLLKDDVMKGALGPVIQNLLMSGSDPKVSKIPTEKLLEASVVLQDLVCKKAFVMPRVVDDPQSDDEISPDDIADIDKQVIMSLLQTSVHKLAESLSEVSQETGDTGENAP